MDGIRAWRQRRQARQDQRALLDGVLNAATHHSIMVTDAQRHITLFSQGAERLTGYRAGDVIGTSPLRFFEPDELRRRAATFETPADEQAVLHGLSAQEPLTRQ